MRCGRRGGSLRARWPGGYIRQSPTDTARRYRAFLRPGRIISARRRIGVCPAGSAGAGRLCFARWQDHGTGGRHGRPGLGRRYRSAAEPGCAPSADDRRERRATLCESCARIFGAPRPSAAISTWCWWMLPVQDWEPFAATPKSDGGASRTTCRLSPPASSNS